MDLKVLRYFDQIVRSGSFARAAERLHLTQPALSKAIHLLEEELEISLLERGRRGVDIRLTVEGAVVLRHARTLLEGRARMLEELAGLRSLDSGLLRIGLPPLGSAQVFAPLVVQYRLQYPGITLELLESGGDDLERALRAGEIELAACMLPLPDDLSYVCLCDEPLMCALPQSHPLATRDGLNITDLKDVPLVQFERSFVLSRFIREACLAAGFEPLEVTRTSHTDFGLALVAAGIGAMLLPSVVALRQPVEGVLVLPIDSMRLRWRIALCWLSGSNLSYAARALIKLLPEIKQNLPQHHD